MGPKMGRSLKAAWMHQHHHQPNFHPPHLRRRRWLAPTTLPT
jgi:hypothetical protein